MDIQSFRGYYEKLGPNPTKSGNPVDDRQITRAELQQLSGGDNDLSVSEAQKLGIDAQSAGFIRKVLEENKKLIAAKDFDPSGLVFQFDPDDQAVQVQRIGGALFNKVVTPEAKDIKGIESDVTLPDFMPDPGRQYTAKTDTGDPLPDAPSTGPLDRPSVYMGGSLEDPKPVDKHEDPHEEMDVGLTWDRVYATGAELRPTYTNQANGCDGGNPANLFLKTKATAVTLDQKNYVSYTDYQGNDAWFNLTDKQPVSDPAEIARLKQQTGTKAIIAIDGQGTVHATDKDVPDFMNKLEPNFAYRPYWRPTNFEVYHPKGNSKVHFIKAENAQGEKVLLNAQGTVVATGDKDIKAYLAKHAPERLKDPKTGKASTNQWNNPAVGTANNVYFYPGEQIKMRVEVTGENQVQLSISAPPKNFRQAFVQEKFGMGLPQQFKHIHSIDQFRSETQVVQGKSVTARVGNERAPFVETAAFVDNIRWNPSFIKADGSTVPLGQNNSLRVMGPDTPKYHSTIFTEDQNGQDINVTTGIRNPPQPKQAPAPAKSGNP